MRKCGEEEDCMILKVNKEDKLTKAFLRINLIISNFTALNFL